jgi:predicted GNAT family acetyltransferase
MTSPADDPTLVLDDARNRYELRRGATVIGFAEFNRVGTDTVMITHSEVDPAFEGQGHGSRLASQTLEHIHAQGKQVIPMCPFVAAYIRRHPEYIAYVRPDARTALKI